MAVVTMRADFEPAIRELMSTEERALAGMQGLVHEIASGVAETVVPYVQAHTPVDTGNLRDSTVAEVSGTGTERTVEVRQPATNEQETEYVQYVVEGHRIVAWGYDTGRTSVGNDYPERAVAEAEPAIQAEIEAQVRLFAERLAKGF